MKNRKQNVILIITAILAAAVIIFALLYSFNDRNASRIYRQSFERAELYYNIGEYEQAVIAYRAAIDADSSAVEAYEGLSNTYVILGNIPEAVEILRTGYQKTRAQRLWELMEQLQQKENEGIIPAKNTGEIVPSINTTLISRIDGSTYMDYVRKAPPVSSETQEDGSIHVRFSEIPGILIFRNSVQQSSAVVEGRISDQALPEEIRLDDIASLLGKAPLTKKELEQMEISSLVRVYDPVHGNMLKFTIRGCVVQVVCEENETIPEDAYNIIIPVDAIARAAGGSQGGGVPTHGNIIDAQTGDPVENITIRFYKEGNASGDPLAETVTGEGGNYEINLPPDVYTVEVSGDGYITTTYDIRIGEYDSSAEEDFVVTKELSEGEIRIVLEWGAVPYDLDSHLTGETDSGTSCHVFFENLSCSDSNGAVADLDLDDVNSYGPETTTIHNMQGVYEFDVNNYTPSSGSLDQSNAVVTVYVPGEAPEKFSIDSDGEVDGVWWHVCTIDHGKLEKAYASSEKPSVPDHESGDDTDLTMEGVGLPYGQYSGEKPQGDGAIPTELILNEDMTYRLHCIFSIFDKGEPDDSDGEYTYHGNYRVDRIDGDGNPILFFENSVENFEMTARGRYLSGEYFSVGYDE